MRRDSDGSCDVRAARAARQNLSQSQRSKLETCFAVYPRLPAKIVTGTSSAFTAAF